MLRSLLMACVLVVVPLQGHANPTAETEEMDFLDLVDGVALQGNNHQHTGLSKERSIGLERGNEG